MIVRMEEARVADGLLPEFRRYVTETLWPRLQTAEGFLGGEVYRSYDGAPRLVMITRWRDEAALKAQAGPAWRDTSFVRPGDTSCLARVPHVWHFAQTYP